MCRCGEATVQTLQLEVESTKDGKKIKKKKKNLYCVMAFCIRKEEWCFPARNKDVLSMSGVLVFCLVPTEWVLL